MSSHSPQRRSRFPFVAGYALWFMPALWRDAARRWRGFGFFYILILLAATLALVFARWHPTVERFMLEDVPPFVASIPTIDIKDGVATTDVPREPHVITWPGNTEPMAIIDTTGRTTDPPAGTPSALLTREKLILRDRGKLEIFAFPRHKPFHADRRMVQKWTDRVLPGYWRVGYPLALGLSLAFRLAQLVIYGLIALAIAAELRPRLGFAACMRLAALALTPVVLVDTMLLLVGTDLGCWWTIAGIALTFTLIILMVRANSLLPLPGTPANAPRPFPAPSGAARM